MKRPQLHVLHSRGYVIQIVVMFVLATMISGASIATRHKASVDAAETTELSGAQYLAGSIIEYSNLATRTWLEEATWPAAAVGSLPDSTAVSLPVEPAVRISNTLLLVVQASERLHETVASEASLEMLGAAADSQAYFARFLHEETLGNFRLFSDRLEATELLAAEARTSTARSVELQGRRTERLNLLAEIGITASTFVSVSLVALATWITGRRLNRALAQARAERQTMVVATSSMQRRNEQFQALYQVISEVSESLSLRYVVQTTIREARQLVGADVVVLRLMEGERLVVGGTAQDVDADVEGLQETRLGVGLVGRVAKRGKSIRIDEDAEASMCAEELIPGIQSGLIIPLIVGARVVGTLSCWSRQPALFGADDEQVLEMMASQVATAVVSANTHEASEHAAHHDALTMLPNRRQLTRDIRERFLPAIASGKSVAFTMIDIDHFKRFNDEFGHKTGDITLQKVAEVLLNTIRPVDSVYRYGGEEFTIVFDGVTAADALPLMERVRAAVGRTTLTGQSGEPVGPVTISSGIAAAPEDGVDCELLMKFADDALYQSKWAGRDRVTLYEKSLAALGEAA